MNNVSALPSPWMDARQLAVYINAKNPHAAREWARRHRIDRGQYGRVHVANVDRVIAGLAPRPNTAFLKAHRDH